MYADLIGTICLMAILFLPFLFLLFYIVKSETSKATNTDKSELVRKKITNSMSKHIFNAIISIVMLFIMFLITYKEYKPLTFIVLLGLAALLKINYRIYFDLAAKDGIIFSGTIVNSYINNVWKQANTDFNYTLEIETDNGEFIKCASKIVGLIPGQRIENAYVTRRTNLLLYYDMLEYI